MSHIKVRALALVAIGTSILVNEGTFAQAPAALEQRVAELKQSLQEKQAQLRRYEWIETTIVNVKGEEKNRKQQRCYYGVDGEVQKVLLAEQKAAPPSGGRLKKKIVAKKTGEMQDYMESAAALIQRYVPPDPADIDSAKKREKVALRPRQGGVARLEFTDYIKPGDLLAVDLDASAKRLGFATLPDGTNYTAQTTLDAKAKNITVVLQKSGYRPVQQ
jgi:hypothetical protein